MFSEMIVLAELECQGELRSFPRQETFTETDVTRTIILLVIVFVVLVLIIILALLLKERSARKVCEPITASPQVESLSTTI